MKTQTHITRTVNNTSKLKAFARDTRGLSTVEYIILLVAVVVGGIGLWGSIGEKLYAELKNADTAIAGVHSAGDDE